MSYWGRWNEMKNILSTTLLLFLTGTIFADSFFIGGKELNIPSPQGYSRVTQQMDTIYRMSLLSEDPMNDKLAYYIAESDIPITMSGKIPSLHRIYILKVNKKLKDTMVNSKYFTEIKTIVKNQNKEIYKSVESQISSSLKKSSKGISKDFDIDFAMQVSQMIPLEPHFETDNAFAYSMYINFWTSVDGAKEKIIISATSTIVNVEGKILFLYCYGHKNDLEWTRNASNDWASKIIDSNILTPSSSGNINSYSGNMLSKGIAGAIAGGLIALIFGVYSRFKKKKG